MVRGVAVQAKLDANNIMAQAFEWRKRNSSLRSQYTRARSSHSVLPLCSLLDPGLRFESVSGHSGIQ
eukprot:1787764-Alexandrium_andersonii.AAC.1